MIDLVKYDIAVDVWLASSTRNGPSGGFPLPSGVCTCPGPTSDTHRTVFRPHPIIYTNRSQYFVGGSGPEVLVYSINLGGRGPNFHFFSIIYALSNRGPRLVTYRCVRRVLHKVRVYKGIIQAICSQPEIQI